jgi:hypothetical protein
MTIGEWLAGLGSEGHRMAYDTTALRAAAAEAVVGVPPDRLPLRLPKRRIEALNTCPRRAVAEAHTTVDAHATAIVIGRLMEIAARMHLWDRYTPGDTEALRAALTEHSAARGNDLPDLDDDVWTDITERADRFAASWHAPDPGIDVFVGERLSIPLAPGPDGRPGVVLTGITDISIGSHHPASPHRPRAVLELKSGAMPSNPLDEAKWYQFVVAAADGYAPHRVAVWAAAPERNAPTGLVADTPVTPGSLESATRWVCDALGIIGAIAAGEKPAERPSGWCRTCPDRTRCPSAALGAAAAPETHDLGEYFGEDDDDGA